MDMENDKTEGSHSSPLFKQLLKGWTHKGKSHPVLKELTGDFNSSSESS